jgi:hypothetical protein
MTWQDKVNPIKVGDKVAYSAKYLRNTGQQTGDTPFMRGVVTAIKPLGDNQLATVQWSPDYSCNVLTVNLSRVTSRGITDVD